VLKGFVYLLISAFLFALMTVFFKFAVNPPYAESAAVGTFIRFFVGLLIFGVPMVLSRRSLRPNNPKLVALRGLLTTSAVTLFYASLFFTTVTKANILNLTYPAFIFLLAPYINHEKPQWHNYIFLALTMIGAWLIVVPGHTVFTSINVGDVLALASGIMAAFAIAVLREARRDDTAEIILFYLSLIGSIITGVLMFRDLRMPHGMGLVHFVLSALTATAGQYLLTIGYRYINAVLGAIVLSSGILFAALLGILVMKDPLTPSITLGALLVLISLIGTSGIFDGKDRIAHRK
jgi:drug/metabolite transporter (DMT)-like permease